jgi:hypothetical protein
LNWFLIIETDKKVRERSEKNINKALGSVCDGNKKFQMLENVMQ